MDAKIILIFIGIINYCHCAGLLRTPKVYNAVITTDEQLTPSRAFPVIQPTIHETGIATYPFGPFNPYRFYNPPIVHLGPPHYPYQGEYHGYQGLIPREQVPVPQPPPQDVDLEPSPEQRMLPSEMEIPSEPQQPQQNSPQPSNRGNNNQMQVSEEKAPIPLNEYGLPPSLVPLQSHPPYQQNPIALQPYTYNHYPLIYEPSLRNYPDQYLPHYGYFPRHTFSIRPPSPKKSQTPPSPPIPQQQQTDTKSTFQQIPNNDNNNNNNNESPTNTKTMNELNNIKNGSGSKNSEVPDVPPPPLPSGAKTSE